MSLKKLAEETGLVSDKEINDQPKFKVSKEAGLKVANIKQAADKMYSGKKVGTSALDPIDNMYSIENVAPIFDRLYPSDFKYMVIEKDYVEDTKLGIVDKKVKDVLNAIVTNAIKMGSSFEHKDKSKVILDFIKSVVNHSIIIESDGKEVHITKGETTKIIPASAFPIRGSFDIK